jgi:hypothetical protein
VTVTFTSSAGVGEKTWMQPTEPGINHLSGTFTRRVEENGSTFEWTGEADFERLTEAFMGGSDGQYKMTSGTFTVTASGSNGAFGVATCSISGSGTFPLSPADSGFFVLPRLAETDPYPYTFTIQPSVAEHKYNITYSSCNEPWEEVTSEWSANFTITPINLQNSADGIDFSGEETIEEPTSTITQTWSFQGTE